MLRNLPSLALILAALGLPCAGAVVFSENFDTVPFVEKHWTYLEGYASYDSNCLPTGSPIYVDGWVYNNMSTGIPGSWSDFFALNGWTICESQNRACEGGVVRCRDNHLEALNNPIGDDQGNQYDWQMDPAEPGNGCYKTAIPQGWTLAFDWWGDEIAHGPAYQRGKMGVSRIGNQYAYSGKSLHMWASHGNMRVVSPRINAPPGAYRLTWRSSVWNLAGPSESIQQLWTDWAQWGWGTTNKENPWTYLPLTQADMNKPDRMMDISFGWHWSKDPYHDSDPEGYIPNRPDGSTRPPGEEAGVWRQWSRSFIVPPTATTWYIGFNCGHGHDPNNPGYRWGTILNIDDIVLEDLPPVSRIADVINLPDGTVVTVCGSDASGNALGKVVTGVYLGLLNAIDPMSPDLLVIEEDDRSSAIEVQYDSWSVYPAPELGDRICVAGILRRLPTGPRICPSDNYTLIKAAGGSGYIEPLMLRSKDIAGGAIPGTPTVGLLSKIGGKVTKVVTTSPAVFILDDGCAVESSVPGKAGVTVVGTNMYGSPPPEGADVVVTGVAALDVIDGKLVRVIRPRHDGDVVKLRP